MSEDEGPKYKDGDIVWVKLGGYWWPAEVTDNGPEDYNPKKPPLVIVKFFNEDTYEFVNSHSSIYRYNCDKKNEFIRKGMDSFRTNSSIMKKFPGDVSLAEIRTDGNPNILSDPIFGPQKRSNVIAEVFGSPSPKKPPKGRTSTSKNSSSKKPKLNITHRRFLGCDDYEAHIRVQYPGKDTENASSDEEEIVRLNAEPTKTFNCSTCPFETNRLEVMLFHVQCHIKGIASPVKKKMKKKKARVFKHVTSDDDRTNSSVGLMDTDSEEEVKPKPKRKKRTPATNPKKPKVKKVEEDAEEGGGGGGGDGEGEEKIATDIRSNLLAEWSDSEENEEAAEDSTSKLETSEENVAADTTKVVEETETEEDKEKKKKNNEEQKDLIKSCFDFDEEEEEEDTSIVHTAIGRRIPRVIPPTEKRKSIDTENEASLPTAEDDLNRIEILKVNETVVQNNDSEAVGKDEEEFKDLMESTSVPDLPEVPDSAKPQQNFPDSKTVKIPDKKSDTEVATKLTNPKKRFVKSFEDFELLQNEQRRAQEEKEEEMRREKAVVVVEPVEQVPENVPEPAPLIETSPVTTTIETSPVTTTIETSPVTIPEPAPFIETSPVTIPDTEPVIEESPVIIPEPEPLIEESPVTIPEPEPIIEDNPVTIPEPEPVIEESPVTIPEPEPVMEESPVTITEPQVMASSPLMVEEPTPPPEESVEEKSEEIVPDDVRNVQISKLKCQVMSKLSDDEPESPKLNKGKVTTHRTPRSKILESYRNDTNKRKSGEEKEETKKIEESIQQLPRKSKFLKFDQEEAEDDEKIEEEAPPAPEEEEDEEIKSDVMKEVEAIPEKNPDEEIGKINQIDEYLNDFLFEFPKKTEEEEEVKKNEVVEEEKDQSNEIQIQVAGSNNDEEGDLNIAIKTNLTNLNKDDDEMSALSTLAMVSQLEKENEEEEEKQKPVEEVVVKKPKPEPELVPIDGNPTVVSEKDLADAQVEITANSSPTCKKPVTLTNFSMDFSECNSNSTSDSVASELSEPKPPKEAAEAVVKKKTIPAPDELFDLEEHIPSQIVDKVKPVKESSPPPSKLLERLTEKPKVTTKVPTTKDSTKASKTKFVIKSAGNKSIKPSKPIILSEKIIKPVKPSESGSVSVQKITSKRNLHDADEIDAFIIQKGTKISDEEASEDMPEEVVPPPKKFKKVAAASVDAKKLQVSGTSVKKRGKAKILQQTIITPAGEIIPSVTNSGATVATAQDDQVFDINSMPIVLSDQILTPESIENMPIYLSETVQATPKVEMKKTTTTTTTPVAIQQRVLNKSVASPAGKLVKTPKILGSVGSKLIKQNSFPTGSSTKHGKYVIVSQPSPATTVSKYTVGKKQVVKRVTGGDLAGTLTKVQNVGSEPTGNKIMILTDQQGQQQRVLLTPAQQKMMGYQNQGAKMTKTVVKGNVIQKSKDGQMTAVPGSSGLITKTMSSGRLNSNQTLISSSGHVLTPIHPHHTKTMRLEKSITGRKIQIQSQKVPLKPPQQKTIIIKNQHGQTVRKIQGTDDALLDKQVAEQIEAIKASGVLQQKQEILNYKNTTPKTTTTFRRSYAKKIDSPKPIQKKSENAIPPLAPISPKKVEIEKPEKQVEGGKQERALHQLVIQDAMGNQTTITEGQILALPSETVDGQPQSYMLVTLDESGNLTPLNNEALLSLDPNLGLGGDLGNTVLQIDQSGLKEETVAEQIEPVKTEPQPELVKEEEEEEKVLEPEVGQEQQIDSSSVMQTMGESGQQLIVTGDPIAAQKFLESLTEGNTDLANILASAEGSSILIQADGQQILINTDSDNQMLLSVNTDNLNMAESTEGGGNPIFATQPSKNQDILAAALADTDVFQQEQNGSQKVAQLSPSSTLYPMNVGNVLETSLTLNSPIMTPLEVPSTNSKKISDESDILCHQVPKNVDLPITITDPNISQTVSQQQVASLMVGELPSNLELSLPTVTSSEMNIYSLPDINQKPFNSSMPLLTEDAEEPEPKSEEKADVKPKEEKPSFLDENEGLCTLGGEMCSSLSEPPPDMFDLSAVLSSHQMKSGKEELKGGDESSESVNTMNDEDSCEIPVQPDIVTSFEEEAGAPKRGGDDDEEMEKCKFD